jgi:hypothetical protein
MRSPTYAPSAPDLPRPASLVTRSRQGWRLLLLGLLPALAACDDDLFRVDWVESPDTVLLYSLARPELNLLSAFDFINRVAVRIESPNATGRWDLVVDTQEGDLVFLPPEAVGVTGSKARIIPMGPVRFEDLRTAPSDTTLYIGHQAVPIVLGHTYVIRTRQEQGFYGQICVFYGKLEALAKDLDAGTVTIVFDASPVCNSRKLYPPK